MKYQILDLVADGAVQDWHYTEAASAWEACTRGSGDSSYIYASELNARVQFTVAPGAYPAYGFVSGITVQYRAKTGIGGAQAGLTLTHNGNALVWVDCPLSTTDWQYEVKKYISYDDGGSPRRFSTADLADLTLEFEITRASESGANVDVSELWLVVEYCTALEYYDPVTRGVTPDAVLGYLAWTTSGTEAQLINADGTLYVEDASDVAYRACTRPLTTYRFPTSTEISLDILLPSFGSVSPDHICVFRLAQVDDGGRSVWLTLVQEDGPWYLGLTGDGLDVDERSTYLATEVLDPEEFTTQTYITVAIDRSEDPANPGKVEVQVNHVTRLTADYRDFPETTSTMLGFGTGDATHLEANGVSANINFWAWQHTQTAGARFRGWVQDVGGTNTVEVNTTDYAIVKPRNAPGVYQGQQLGQSPYCCELSVQDPTAVCSVYQVRLLPDPMVAYDLFVDYRVTVFGQTAEVLVQRTSDFQYWDQAGGVWAVGEISSTLPAATTRQYGHATMTNILSGVADDSLLVRVRCIGGAPAHSVLVYKILLQPA